MKKKIFASVFAAVLMLTLAFTVSAKNVDTIVTNNGKYGFELKTEEEGLVVSGIVQQEDMMYLLVSTDKNYVVNITPEVKFITTIKYPEGDKSNVGIFVGSDIKESFISIFFGEDITIEKKDGKWSFVINDEIYNNNEMWMSGWVNPEEHLDRNQPNAVKMVTSSVVYKIESDYEKAEAIHRWVADNIYYDKDYALNTKTKTALTPVEVLTDRVSVCEGYANLTVAMLNSANIPAIAIKGYALGVDTPTSWSEVKNSRKANHMWVEAYVDGKWIIMDPTWDSKNMSYNGKKEAVPSVTYRYFDMTPELLASDYKILDRPNYFGKMGISSWAETEVMAAVEKDLVIDSIRETMKNNITREEFCDLVVNLVSVKMGKPIDAVLTERGLELNYEFFNDLVDFNILAANALGIVNGKENNMFDASGFITRQEAAVMLQRTAKVLGATAPNSTALTFADANKFPSWSADAIAFVSASLSSQGTRVMGGVQDNKFDPVGYYTKEQSILTIYRLFNTY